MKELSRVAKVVTPSPIRQMFNRAMGMEDVVSFTVGEPDFETPAHIVDAAVKALHEGAHHYTPNAGILPLRQAIFRVTRQSHGVSYDPETQIIVTAGGMEALLLTMITLTDPEDEWILSDPCWTNYSRQVLICGGKPVYVEANAQTNFHFDPDALEQAITEKTKGFIINSPSNPTGGIANRALLEKLAEVARKHDLYVISDEVYGHLTYDGNEMFSIASLPGMAERTIVVDSFSKTYAMTGWRVGYALGPKEIIENMVKLQENVAACVNSAAQFGALAALGGTQEPLHQMQAAYCRRREIITEGFASIDGLHCFAPQGAFYALVDIGETGMQAMEFAMDLLEKERVVVVPGHAFGEQSNRYVRLSFATSEENIREGLRRIARYMKNRQQEELP